MGKGGETLKRKQLQHRKAYFETKNTFGILKSKKDGKTINKICTISKAILISKYIKSLKALKGQECCVVIKGTIKATIQFFGNGQNL